MALRTSSSSRARQLINHVDPRVSLPKDIQEFLLDYPSLSPSPSPPSALSENLDFYSNKLRCRPDGAKIGEILAEGKDDKDGDRRNGKGWWGDYGRLERNHGFIQWLFPIREHGMNCESQPLQIHERNLMRGDPIIKNRILESYKLMLDFYGMQLLSPTTGQISRSSTRDQPTRYRNLLHSMHNYLRITRILKCLQELGWSDLPLGFLGFCFVERGISARDGGFGGEEGRGLRESMDRWWVNTLRREEERKWFGELVGRVRKGDGLWTVTEYEAMLDRRKRMGSVVEEASATPDGDDAEQEAEGQQSSEKAEANGKHGVDGEDVTSDEHRRGAKRSKLDHDDGTAGLP